MGAHTLDTNLYFIHRGVIEPKSGIGAHFLNKGEEMFVILDGEAYPALRCFAIRIAAWTPSMRAAARAAAATEGSAAAAHAPAL